MIKNFYKIKTDEEMTEAITYFRELVRVSIFTPQHATEAHKKSAKAIAKMAEIAKEKPELTITRMFLFAKIQYFKVCVPFEDMKERFIDQAWANIRKLDETNYKQILREYGI